MTKHDTVAAWLDDYVDGLLDAAGRAEVRQHLADCTACRRDVEAIRRLQASARELPSEIEPPRDLWAGIAARIGVERPTGHAEPVPIDAEPTDRVKVIRIDARRPAHRRWWMRRDLLAAAAMILVLFSSAVTAALVRGRAADAAGPLAVATTPVPAPAASSALIAFEPAEQALLGTTEQLEFALEAQRDRLSPETVAVVEDNLRIIDGAIREARAALEADPNNRDLTFLLMDIYKKKVDLLQSAVQISSI